MREREKKSVNEKNWLSLVQTTDTHFGYKVMRIPTFEMLNFCLTTFSQL